MFREIIGLFFGKRQEKNVHDDDQEQQENTKDYECLERQMNVNREKKLNMDYEKEALMVYNEIVYKNGESDCYTLHMVNSYNYNKSDIEIA